MNDPLEQQTVVDFVLESEKHLDTAARLAKAFPAAQRQIVVLMLEELEVKLKAALGSGWMIYSPKNDVFVANYPGFDVWRESWGEIRLKLESQGREGACVVGARRAHKPELAAMNEAVADAFTKAGLPGERNRWWTWYKVLPAAYGDWNSAPALAAMHFRQKETVEMFASEILRVQQIATPVIDAFTSGS